MSKMVVVEKVNAGWKVRAVSGPLTGWLTKQEYAEIEAAFEANGIVDETMIDDVWMMYVDARWNRQAKSLRHDAAIANAVKWNAMMTGKMTIEEYEKSDGA